MGRLRSILFCLLLVPFLKSSLPLRLYEALLDRGLRQPLQFLVDPRRITDGMKVIPLLCALRHHVGFAATFTHDHLVLCHAKLQLVNSKHVEVWLWK